MGGPNGTLGVSLARRGVAQSAAHGLWEPEVAGSNPAAPTTLLVSRTYGRTATFSTPSRRLLNRSFHLGEDVDLHEVEGDVGAHAPCSREERAVVVWQAATDECVTARIQWRISKEPGGHRRAPCGMLGEGAQ